tara:strand:- start:944 stop:1075 length:132 start_codon:yes stop_codon:yes gene_type:complete
LLGGNAYSAERKYLLCKDTNINPKIDSFGFKKGYFSFKTKYIY